MELTNTLLILALLVVATYSAAISDDEKTVLESWLAKMEGKSGGVEQQTADADADADADVDAAEKQPMQVEVAASYPNIGSPSAPGHQFWRELLHSLPSIKNYLENLDECLVMAEKYRIIEDYFSPVGDDSEALETAQIALCRFAFILHEVYNKIPEEGSQPASQSAAQTQQTKRQFNSFEQGPIELKRANSDSQDEALMKRWSPLVLKKSSNSEYLRALARELAEKK